jgi:hypothetical protein
MKNILEELRCPKQTRHFPVQFIRQRVYQLSASYEDCNDSDCLLIDPALRLAVHRMADQAPDQSGGGQAFLPPPEVLCQCGLGFSSITLLSGGARLGSLGSPPVKYLGSEVGVCTRPEQN